MELLEFVEAQGQRSAAFSLNGLDVMRQRAHALLATLLGGGGAAGAYALGQLDKAGGLPIVASLGAVSLWWFVLAAWMAVSAVRTKEVHGPAGEGPALLEQALKFDAYIEQARLDGEAPKDCLTLMREMEIRTLQKSAHGHRQASVALALSLDRVYLGAAATPVWAGLGLWLARYLG